MTTLLDDQLDLFTVDDVVAIQPKPPRLEELPITWQLFGDDQGTGPVARWAAWRRWRAEFGSFGSLRRAHAWTPAAGGGAPPDAPEGACVASVWTADLRCDHPSTPRHGSALGGPRPDSCRCVGDLMYRGVCSCGWEGPIVDDENTASESILSHIWPGWAELPIAPSWTFEGSDAQRVKALAVWLDGCVAAGYELDWLEAGGPIRTLRKPRQGRHVPGRTPFGGYDVAVEENQS